MGYQIQKHAQSLAVDPYVKVPFKIVYELPTATDASSGVNIYDGNFPFGAYITNVTVICTKTVGSGTITLSDGTTDITDAIACATDKAVDYAATIDDASYQLEKNDTLTITSNGATDAGVVIIEGYLS